MYSAPIMGLCRLSGLNTEYDVCYGSASLRSGLSDLKVKSSDERDESLFGTQNSLAVLWWTLCCM